ncbi:TetR/AcrR family transcriptional regulator [Vibrio mexicanus]|uniref:TetR/AcrR family transcriptional regulator n=1 Tax=Vibrio mexicanus TaxID=1004326 RepID=UPI00063C6EE8|nr:TetR/AcrR family transcriptional regulator [Vibrio mexicanus]
MSKGKVTREYILTTAFQLASENGLESLTIGGLAKLCGMSKSGLFAHFNSKDNLQLAVLNHANEVFRERVITPARVLEGISVEQKLRTLLNNWLGWNHSFQGSCMFLDAWREQGLEQTDIQIALKETVATWVQYLSIQIQKGIDSGEFRHDIDAEQATFELYGLYLSAHTFYSIKGHEKSEQFFWNGVERFMESWKVK